MFGARLVAPNCRGQGSEKKYLSIKAATYKWVFFVRPIYCICAVCSQFLKYQYKRGKGFSSAALMAPVVKQGHTRISAELRDIQQSLSTDTHISTATHRDDHETFAPHFTIYNNTYSA